MKKVLYLLASVSLIILFSSTNSIAQCRTFAKKKCVPEMEPYIHDGQISSTIISEGESVELYKTFYEGQDYRVLVCSDKEFENNKIRVRLLDHNRKVLYDNQDHDYTKIWDFIANATQQVIIEVSIPKTGDESAVSSGCISILIGFLNTDGMIKK